VDQDLDAWLGQIRVLFESDTRTGEIHTLLQKRPSCHELARADVVETLCLLQAMHQHVMPAASPALPTSTA